MRDPCQIGPIPTRKLTCDLTPKSILDTITAFGGLLVAHEVFDFLTHGEFPERCVFLLKDAEAEIRSLPRSPGEEDPDLSSFEQTMGLLRTYTVNGKMLRARDYQPCDRKRGVWKWKTRTVRIAGIYVSGQHQFVIARVGFARLLKRGGRAITEKEAEFADTAADRLTTLGVLVHAWRCQDPHYDEAHSFDPN
jgi:hypothetical protein